MNYQETIEYLYNQVPMFEKQGQSGYKEGLNTTILFDQHFNHPHQSYKTIHIGGTNGKGSCSHTIAAILQLLGYKVGLYTSPHLIDFKERIKVNGKPISEKYVVNFVEKEKSFYSSLNPSFFEITTAMAFKYFKDENVDIAIIEVGLGGRLDCTNIINPILSIITNISLDHTQLLGNSLCEIANEKAGIIKESTPVIIGENNELANNVFITKAHNCNSQIIFAEDNNEIYETTNTKNLLSYKTHSFGNITGELIGSYQEKNSNTILVAYKKLFELLNIDNLSIEEHNSLLNKAFLNVTKITGLLGRWQIVKNNPLTICDTGHNIGAWKYISKQLASIKCNKLHIIMGMVDDKDYKAVIDLLPSNAKYYFTHTEIKRCLDCSVLYTIAMEKGLNANKYESVKIAYSSAVANADKEDVIFIGGSTYIVADFMKDTI